MKRSQFLSLLLSPLIAPFVKAEEQKVTYPNGSEVYFTSDDFEGGVPYVFEGVDLSGRIVRSRVSLSTEPTTIDMGRILKITPDINGTPVTGKFQIDIT